MKPLRLFTIIFFILICSGILRSIAQRRASLAQTGIRHEDLLQVFPEAHSFQRILEPPVYKALNIYNDTIGYIVPTKNLVTGVSGYGGPIHLLIGITPQGDIIKAAVTEHHETPGFSKRINKLLDQLTGRNIHTAFIIGKNIDGITGATVTSTAIIETINASAEKISDILSLERHGAAFQKQPFVRMIIPIAIGLTLFLLSGWSCLKRKKILRWIALFSGFFILGLAAQNMLSTSHLAGIALWQIPAWQSNPLWHILIIGAVLSCLFIGRVYCAGVCPFGLVEELIHAINTTFFRLSMSPDQTTDYLCRWIKYIILLGLMGLCLIHQRSGIGAVEVYIPLFTLKHSLWSRLLIGSVLLGSFFFIRFWCRYLCPFGAFLAMITQFRFGQQKPSTHICAETAECFYCHRCTYKDIFANTKKQTSFFISILIATLIIFGFVIRETMISVSDPHTPSEKNLAIDTHQEYIDNSAIKKHLKDAGITPYPAKYWKTIDE